MRAVDAIALFIALGLFIKGFSLLFILGSLKELYFKYLKRPTKYFNRVGWLSLFAGLLLVAITLKNVDIINIIIIIVGSWLFGCGWVLLFAQKQLKELWTALLSKKKSWFIMMGILHIILAVLIVWIITH